MFEWYVYVFCSLLTGVTVYVIFGLMQEAFKPESAAVGDGYMEDELCAG